MKYKFRQVTAAAILGLAIGICSDAAQAQFGGSPVTNELGRPSISGQDFIDSRTIHLQHRGIRSKDPSFGKTGNGVDRAGTVTKGPGNTVILGPAKGDPSGGRLGIGGGQIHNPGSTGGRLGLNSVPQIGTKSAPQVHVNSPQVHVHTPR